MQRWLTEATHTMQRSIFILRSAKWGHSGGPEYIPPSPSWIIHCLLFLSNPKGRRSVCVWARLCARWQHLPRAQTSGWIQPMWQTESRLFNEKVDERWHSLAASHTPPPPPPPCSLQHSDFHLEEQSRHWVVTATTTNKAYSPPHPKKKKRKIKMIQPPSDRSHLASRHTQLFHLFQAKQSG